MICDAGPVRGPVEPGVAAVFDNVDRSDVAVACETGIGVAGEFADVPGAGVAGDCGGFDAAFADGMFAKVCISADAMAAAVAFCATGFAFAVVGVVVPVGVDATWAGELAGNAGTPALGADGVTGMDCAAALPAMPAPLTPGIWLCCVVDDVFV